MKELIEDDLTETQSEIDRIKSYLDDLYRERASVCDSILRNENDLDRLRLREEILKQNLKQIKIEENNEKER